MKWSAKAILEYLQSQEVNSKEDYERIIKELELAATEAQANRVRNKTEKAEAKKGIKAKAEEMLTLIELDHQEDTLLLKEAMNDPVVQTNYLGLKYRLHDKHIRDYYE